jgi:hypothetical protein
MFGLFKPPGKLEIALDKMSHSFGESLKGRVKLEMDKPKKAKALRLTLFAERSVPRVVNGKRRSERQTVYTFSTELDGEGEYSGSKEYGFELKIPAQNGAKLPEGTLGQVAGIAVAAAQFSGMAPGMAKWHLKANLDIPMGQDVVKQLQLNIA